MTHHTTDDRNSARQRKASSIITSFRPNSKTNNGIQQTRYQSPVTALTHSYRHHHWHGRGGEAESPTHGSTPDKHNICALIPFISGRPIYHHRRQRKEARADKPKAKTKNGIVMVAASSTVCRAVREAGNPSTFGDILIPDQEMSHRTAEARLAIAGETGGSE